MKRLMMALVLAAAVLAVQVAPLWAQEATASDVPPRTTNAIVIVAVVLAIVAIIVAIALRKKLEAGADEPGK